MLVKVPVQFVQKQMNTSPYLDLFAWMLCRIDEKVLFYWFLTQQSENFPVFMADVGMWFTPDRPRLSAILGLVGTNISDVVSLLYGYSPLLYLVRMMGVAVTDSGVCGGLIEICPRL